MSQRTHVGYEMYPTAHLSHAGKLVNPTAHVWHPIAPPTPHTEQSAPVHGGAQVQRQRDVSDVTALAWLEQSYCVHARHAGGVPTHPTRHVAHVAPPTPSMHEHTHAVLAALDVTPTALPEQCAATVHFVHAAPKYPAAHASHLAPVHPSAHTQAHPVSCRFNTALAVPPGKHDDPAMEHCVQLGYP